MYRELLRVVGGFEDFCPEGENSHSGLGSCKEHPRARNDYDEETAYESYMNPEPGFQSGPGDSTNAD